MSVKQIKRIEEKQPLWENENPNKDIFVIPTLEGSDEDDQGHGSIGDATAEHIHRMNHKMLELEGFVHMPDGNIFRTEENTSAIDESNSKDLKKLLISSSLLETGEKFTEKNKEALIAYLNEEIKQKELALEEKEDAQEHSVISFEDWIENPQMTKSVDLPSTPRPNYIHCGNSSQIFYDWFPEDHPDKKVINGFLLSIKQIDWDDWNSKTTWYFTKSLEQFNLEHLYVKDVLTDLVYKIETSENIKPANLIKEALADIEEDWRNIVINKVFAKIKKDPIFQELIQLNTELKRNKGNLAWNKISKVGKSLYSKHKNSINTSHWNFYKQLKSNWAPTLLVGNIDLNKANMNELRHFFKKRFVTEIETTIEKEESLDLINKKIEDLSAQIFFNRPFMSLEETSKVIRIEDIAYTNNNVVFISLIRKAFKTSESIKNIKPITQLAQEIIDIQKANLGCCSEEEWAAVWQCYRIAKKQIQEKLL